MIWTFKFDFHEWWCPRCGLLDGMFGGNSYEVTITKELKARNRYFTNKAKEFLSSRSDDVKYAYAKHY